MSVLPMPSTDRPDRPSAPDRRRGPNDRRQRDLGEQLYAVEQRLEALERASSARERERALWEPVIDDLKLLIPLSQRERRMLPEILHAAVTDLEETKKQQRNLEGRIQMLQWLVGAATIIGVVEQLLMHVHF